LELKPIPIGISETDPCWKVLKPIPFGRYEKLLADEPTSETGLSPDEQRVAISKGFPIGVNP